MRAAIHPVRRADRSPHIIRLAGIMVVMAVTVLYAATLSPSTNATDSVEFQIVSDGLRIAHAPGYSLYTLLGWLVTRGDMLDVAWRMNALSALAGVVAVALVFALTVRLSGSAVAGAVSGWATAVAPGVWSQAVVTEVYTLHLALLAATLLALARAVPSGLLPGGRDEGRGRTGWHAGWLAAAVTLGALGFTHHLTTVFLYPVLGVAVLASLWSADAGLRWRRLALLVLAGGLGLLPLLYFPWRWEPVIGHRLGLQEFIDYVLGRNYPGLFDAGRILREPGRWSLVASRFDWAHAPTVLVAAVGGMWILWRRARWIAYGLVAIAVLFVVFYTGYFAWDGWVVLQPAHLIVAILAGIGLASLLRAGMVEPSGWRSVLALAVLAIVIVDLGRHTASVFPRVDASGGWAPHVRAEAALTRPLPEGARVVIDPAIGSGFLYEHIIEGVRSDLDVVYADWDVGRDTLADPTTVDGPVAFLGVAPEVAAGSGAGSQPPHALGPWAVFSAPAPDAEPRGVGARTADGEGVWIELAWGGRGSAGVAIDPERWAERPDLGAARACVRMVPDDGVSTSADGPGEDADPVYYLAPSAPVHGTAPVDRWSGWTEPIRDAMAVPLPSGTTTDAWDVDVALVIPPSSVRGAFARLEPDRAAVLGCGDPDAWLVPWTSIGGLTVDPDAREADDPVRARQDGRQPGVTAFAGGLALDELVVPRRVEPGDWLRIDTRWRALREPPVRLKAFVHLLDRGEGTIVGRDREIRYGAWPTDTWVPGDVHDDAFWLRIPDDAPHGPALLELGLYERDELRRAPVMDDDGDPVADRLTRAVWIETEDHGSGDLPGSDATAGGRIDARLTDDIALLGWELAPPPETVAGGSADSDPRGAPQLRLRFRPDAPPTTDWTIFVHILSAPDAVPIAQADTAPWGGRMPTSRWPAETEIVVPIPLQEAAFEARWLAVGLYRADGTRAMVDGTDTATARVRSDERRVLIDLEAGDAP